MSEQTLSVDGLAKAGRLSRGEFTSESALDDSVDEHINWYALQVRARHERVVSSLIEQKGLASFLPVYRSRRRWSDRIKEIEMPLFPAYVFARMNAAERLPVLKTSGVIRIVGIGNHPLPVDDREMQSIRRVIASGASCEPLPRLVEGNRVRILAGPLRNTEGVLVRIKNDMRLVVSISLLQRSISVEVDRDCVTTPTEKKQEAAVSVVSGY